MRFLISCCSSQTGICSSPRPFQAAATAFRPSEGPAIAAAGLGRTWPNFPAAQPGEPPTSPGCRVRTVTQTQTQTQTERLARVHARARAASHPDACRKNKDGCWARGAVHGRVSRRVRMRARRRRRRGKTTAVPPPPPPATGGGGGGQPCQHPLRSPRRCQSIQLRCLAGRGARRGRRRPLPASAAEPPLGVIAPPTFLSAFPTAGQPHGARFAPQRTRVGQRPRSGMQRRGQGPPSARRTLRPHRRAGRQPLQAAQGGSRCGRRRPPARLLLLASASHQLPSCWRPGGCLTIPPALAEPAVRCTAHQPVASPPHSHRFVPGLRPSQSGLQVRRWQHDSIVVWLTRQTIRGEIGQAGSKVSISMGSEG